MQPLVILYVFTGLLLSAISIPLILGKIKRNWIYGIRTRRTLSSDDIWFPVNAYGGRWLFGTGLLIAAMALALLLLPGISLDNYVIGVTVVMLVMLAISIVMTMR